MSRLGFLFLVLALLTAFEFYVFNGLSILFEASVIFQYTYWAITMLTFIGFYIAYINFQKTRSGVRPLTANLFLGFGFAVFVGKIIFAGLLIFLDTVRMIIGLISSLYNLFVENNQFVPQRNYELVLLIGLLAVIPFISMIYGMTLGKYKFKVEDVNLSFSELPKAFHGFKIVQISDIHAGSFDSLKQVKKGIDLIKRQKADLIVFTGDLVNSLKEEIDPYLDIFSSLNAPSGMYSILGNHDYYGMYKVAQKDPLARRIYMDDFNIKHKKIGFKLLLNESITLEKDKESIKIVGVENWGAGPFPKNGDLNLALQEVESDDFTILLSHDPTHWDHHVIPHQKKIHLTLSGHTHGMQFGINLGKFKWSPVKYRYKRWMGLYEIADQLLYVNRGFGFLAWPGRVGMSPEITVFHLNSTKI